MRQTQIWIKIFVIIFIVGSAISWTSSSVHAETQNFSGNFNVEDTDGMYIDISFILGGDSTISFEFSSQCTNQENEYLEFYTSWGGKVAIVQATGIVQPYGPMPMTTGSYRVRLRCRNEMLDPPSVVGYQLTVSSTAISTSFATDPEPDASEAGAITLNKTKSFVGRMGLGGYVGLQDSPWSSSGIDQSDSYYFNFTKDTKIKFKLEYDSNFINNPFFANSYDPGDLEILINKVKDGQTYYVDTFDRWQFSGDISKEITLKEDGMYKVSVRGAYGSLLEKTNYGGYKTTVILNGELGDGAKIGGIQNISTRYWSTVSEEYLTVKEIVPGYTSKIDISIANYYSESIATTLVYGLSVKGGPVKIVGATKLNLIPGGTFAVYKTTLTTPSDTPFALKGDLVVVLYDSNNQTLDTFTTKVDIWSERAEYAIVMATILELLLDD